VLVVFVEHGDVVIDVLLLHIHAAQAVLDDHRHFIGEGGVVGNAVGNGGGEQVGMAVLVLQPFPVQGGAPGGAPNEEAPGALVGGRPAQIHGALQAKHGIEDVEGHHLHPVGAVAGPGGDPVCHGPCFVDAFLEDLPGAGFLVEHQLVVVFRHVLLAFLIPDAELAEHAFHAKGAGFVRHDGDNVFGQDLVLEQVAEDAYQGHGGGKFPTLAGSLEQAVKGRQGGHGQGLCGAPPGRDIAPQGVPPGLHVGHFRGIVREFQVGHLFDLVVRNGQAETVPHALQGVRAHFLRLVGDVHGFPGHPHAVTLDGLGQDHRGLALGFRGGLEGGVNLEHVVAAPVQGPDVVIGPVRHQLLQFRGVEEMLPHIGPVFGLEGLIFPVHAFHHAFFQDALFVPGEEGVPMSAPDELDDIPASAPEVPFQFLDDFAVAPHRAIQPLQVAVHHENQVIQLFPGRHADGPQGFHFVDFPVPQEGPDLATGGLGHVPAIQVFHEAGGIDGLQRPQTHGDSGELPEIRHQPGVGVGGNALAVHFLTVTVHLLFGEATEHEGPGINPGYGVALEVNQIPAPLRRGGAPEPVEAHVVEHGAGSEGGNVAPHVGVLVGPDHHGRGIPADHGADFFLHVRVPRVFGLLIGRDGVDVFGGGAIGEVDAVLPRFRNQAGEEEMGPIRALLIDDPGQGVNPFPGFTGVQIGVGRKGGRGGSCHDFVS